MNVLTPFRHSSARILLSSLTVVLAPWCGFAESAPLAKIEATLADRLTAEDGGPFDLFGHAVAISGTTAVIGAPREDGSGRCDGAAYVFEKDPVDGDWGQVAKLTPQMEDKAFPFCWLIDHGDEFGHTVAVSGDVVVVGAPGEDAGAQLDAGAAYVFERDAGGAGNWGRVARLSDGLSAIDRRRFGFAVAVSGDTAVVGAPGMGAAYVFERDAEGTWAASAELAAAGGEIGGSFGFSAAIHGATALVGAPFMGEVPAGAAFVFERGGDGAWSRTARLEATDPDPGDRFGFTVAIADATAVVGSPKDDLPEGERVRNAGSAFVFQRDDSGAWTRAQRLVASDRFRNDRFGVAAAISGGTVIVGASGNDVHNVTGGHGSGSVYVFRGDAVGVWGERTQIFDLAAGLFDVLGEAVAVAGNTVLTGTPENNDRGPSSGSVMVVELDAGSDLAVTIEESIDPVPAGSGLTYEIRVENRGPLDAAGISLEGALTRPAGVRLVRVAASSGQLSGATWTMEGLASGESAILTLDLEVDSQTPAAEDALGASIALVGFHELDADSANNSASVTTSIASAE